MKKDFKNIDKRTYEPIHRVNSGHKNFENKKVELDLEEKIKNKYTQLRFYFDFEFADKLQKYRYAPEYKVENIISTEKDTRLH
ncbi:MAG: Unknown protein [uncultured Sulfurovum sp.]|uniref:Uncharacterized protein n=1 Tax=uncultured Sulfurovum sp. TaxID=269237 RepID=A0A6S6SP92_9BACT|nr:MAG: Unknown protein [uncultured Sulfurovum sp.]